MCAMSVHRCVHECVCVLMAQLSWENPQRKELVLLYLLLLYKQKKEYHKKTCF